MSPARRDGLDEVTLAEAQRRLGGLGVNTLFKLALLRALTIVDVAPAGATPKWVVRIEPGADLASLHDRWLSRVLRWNHRTAVAHKTVRSLCRIAEDVPQPAGLDEFVGSVMTRTGRTAKDEAVAFFRDRGRKHPDRDRVLAKVRRGLLRTPRSTNRAATPAMAVERFPALARLPRTCLDPDPDVDHPAPPPAVLGRALAMQHLAPFACLFVLVAAAALRTPRQLKAYLGAIEKVDAALESERRDGDTGEDEGTDAVPGTAAVTAALEKLLGSVAPRREGAAAVANACRLFRIALKSMRLYALVEDGDARRGLRALLPGDHADPDAFRSKLHSYAKRVGMAGGKRRKRDADRAADRMEAHVRAANHRLEQIVATSEHADAARTLLARHLERRDALPPEERARMPAFVEFLVPNTVLTPTGDLVPGGAQVDVYWAWRERDAWDSLAPGSLRLQRGMSRRRGPRPQGIRERSLVDQSLANLIADHAADPTRGHRIVFEHRGTRPMEGSAAHEPWFVTKARLGVELSPGELPARAQRRRHRLIECWNLSTRQWLPSGLLTPDAPLATLMRWMIERNRTFVPLAELEPAYRLGGLGVHLVVDTLCRAGEALQISQDASRWRTDDATGEATIGFLTIPKLAPNEPVPEPIRMDVAEQTFVEAMEVAERIARLNGREDGWLPTVETLATDTHKLAASMPLIFQWRAKALTPSHFGYLIASLLANRGHVTPHVLRHAMSNLLRELGVPERVIQVILRHRTFRMTLWYARETLRQSRRAHARDAWRDRHAAAMAAAKVAGTGGKVRSKAA